MYSDTLKEPVKSETFLTDLDHTNLISCCLDQMIFQARSVGRLKITLVIWPLWHFDTRRMQFKFQVQSSGLVSWEPWMRAHEPSQFLRWINSQRYTWAYEASLARWRKKLWLLLQSLGWVGFSLCSALPTRILVARTYGLNPILRSS